MTSTLATVFGDATTPAERPSREDMWTLLIVEMRRNKLPAPKEIRFNDGDDSLVTIEPGTRYDHSVWAQHFGQTVRSRAASGDEVWVYEAFFRWNGHRIRLCTFVRPTPAEPVRVSATASLVDELAASLSEATR